MTTLWLGPAALTAFGLMLMAMAGRALAQWARPQGPAATAEAGTTIEAFGALEVVAHERPPRRPTVGANAPDRSWSLRWQGQDLSLASRGGLSGDSITTERRVNAVYVLGDGPQADLIVNVGDPGHTSAFHLLRQAGGLLQSPLICVTPGAASTVGWIDGPQARQGTRRAYNGPQLRRLSGGRLLGLGPRCVYDTHDRVAFELPRPPADGTLVDRLGALGVSPDGRQVAYLQLRRTEGAEALGVIVADLRTQDWYRLAIDRQRMRFPSLESLDTAWLAHHFEWRPARGDFRLIERAGFEPLPHRGAFIDGQGAEFRLSGTVAGARHTLADHLARRFGAQAAPRPATGIDTFVALRLRDHVVVVSDIGLHVNPPADVHLRGYWPGQLGDPALARQLAHEIGDAINAELAAGRLQDLFETREPATEPRTPT